MAITVVDKPGAICFSKNPIEFHLRTDNWVITQPVIGVYEIEFLSKPTGAVGDAIVLNWGAETETFTVVATGSAADGNSIPEDITSTTLTQYVTALADTWFKANWQLEQDWIIEYAATNKVRFTAKDPAHTITVTGTTLSSSIAVFITNTAGQDYAYKDDFTIVLDIEVEETYGSGTYTRIGTLHADPILYNDGGTYKGDVRIDVSEILDGFLQAREDKPDPTSTTAFIADNTNLQWRAIFAERYTDSSGDVVHRDRQQPDATRVIKGGLRYYDYPDLSDLVVDHYGAALKPLQTWQPTTKEVTTAELHWIYWLTPHQLTGVDQYRSQFTVYYTDGTTATSGPDTVTAQDQYETYGYAVGFNQRGLDLLQPTKTPYKYTWYLTIQGTASLDTITVTFMLVDETRQDRYFIFENGAQGWDTLRTNGDFESGVSVSKTEAKKVVQNGYSKTAANILQRSQGYQDSFEVFTGLKPKEEAQHLRDFLNAEKYYEIVNDELVPIIVEKGSVVKLEHDRTGDYVYGLTFTYRHAFINKAYSNV